MSSTEEKYTILRNIFPERNPFYLRRMCLLYCTTEEGFNNFVDNALQGSFPGDTVARDAVDTMDPVLEEQRSFLFEILPDADRAYLQRKFNELVGRPSAIEQFVHEKVITSDYPKITTGSCGTIVPSVEREVHPKDVFNVETFLQTFPDPFKHFGVERKKVSESYRRDAIKYLTNRFVEMDKDAIGNALRDHSWNLYLTSKFLMESEDAITPKGSCFDFRGGILQEIHFIENEENIKDSLTKIKLKEEEERAVAEEQGTLLFCETCLSDHVPSQIKPCNDGHLFCKECLKTGFMEHFCNGGCEFHCYYENCDSTFSLKTVESIVSPMVFSSILCRIQILELAAANIEDMAKCPFCDAYVAIPAKDSIVFQCQNPDCRMESCLKCHKKSHIPLSCEETAERQTKMRVFIEDRMSNALMRNCWNCKASFIKESGCNRIKCIKCKATTCYICRKQVDAENYKHFYGNGISPSEAAGRCPLFSSDEELHIDAVEKEAVKAKEQVLAENPGVKLVDDPTEFLRSKE